MAEELNINLKNAIGECAKEMDMLRASAQQHDALVAQRDAAIAQLQTTVKTLEQKASHIHSLPHS